MALIFSDFYKLDQLVKLKLRGVFSNTWDGTYLDTANGKEPNPGSGLASGALRMHDESALPAPIQALLHRRGLIYIFASTSYPVLYVGISNSDLKTGVFGSGRFSHHARKLLAARGGGTNHTSGWTEHAVQRYRDFVNALEHDDATLDGIASHLCGDWRFAFASCDSPEQHEGFVLDQMEAKLLDFLENVIILNTTEPKRVEIELQLPPNLDTVVSQSAPRGGSNNRRKHA